MILYHLFYDDFARFFIAVDDLNKTEESLFSCVNLSGYLYTLFNRKRSYFATLKSLFYPSNASLTEIELDYLTQYHNGLFKGRASQLYNYYIHLIKKNKVKKVIISGDSRLSSRALKLACEHQGIKPFFFEQGPNGTTIIDKSGVNANCSFRQDFKNFNQNNLPIKAREKLSGIHFGE